MILMLTFYNAVKAKAIKHRFYSFCPPPLCPPSLSYSFKAFGSGPVQIWRSREGKWKTKSVTVRILFPMDLCLQNTVKRSQGFKCERVSALWIFAPFCDNVKALTPTGESAKERTIPAVAILFQIKT